MPEVATQTILSTIGGPEDSEWTHVIDQMILSEDSEWTLSAAASSEWTLSEADRQAAEALIGRSSDSSSDSSSLDSDSSSDQQQLGLPPSPPTSHHQHHTTTLTPPPPPEEEEGGEQPAPPLGLPPMIWPDFPHDYFGVLGSHYCRWGGSKSKKHPVKAFNGSVDNMAEWASKRFAPG